ncbi:MAG: hypothetical protein QM708_02695 [Propioniciclava sp.]|uniref:hypothetical protein n=1 Tax=Propioniciclava sp. TaxID=2038686 RepID=UPI0039E6E551
MTQPWHNDPYQRRPLDINAYAPPKRGGGGLWFAVIGALLVGAVLAALFLRPAAAPSTAPASTPTPARTSEANGAGMPFVMPGDSSNQGRWEIVSHSWSDAGLIVNVRVTADAGRITYAFVAFSNDGGTTVHEPQAGAPEPQIGSGRLSAGQSITGNLFIPMPRGPATLILTTEGGRQISALAVSG